MGMLNELWSNSQLNALKGMPRGPAWKASGVKCLFFKSAANVGCFQVLLLLCWLPLASPPQQPFSCGGGYRVEVMGKRRPLKYNFLFSVPNLCTLVFQRCLVTLNGVSDNADNGFLAHNGETRRSWRADGAKIWMSVKVHRGIQTRPEGWGSPVLSGWLGVGLKRRWIVC